MDQTCLANSGGFAPISFPLLHGVRFGGGRIELSSSMVILLEFSEDGMVRRMPDPLNYGSFREWSRHRLGITTSGATGVIFAFERAQRRGRVCAAQRCITAPEPLATETHGARNESKSQGSNQIFNRDNFYNRFEDCFSADPEKGWCCKYFSA